MTSDFLPNRFFFLLADDASLASFDIDERFLLPAELAFSPSEAELFPDEVSSSSDAVEVFFFRGLAPAREAGRPKCESKSALLRFSYSGVCMCRSPLAHFNVLIFCMNSGSAATGSIVVAIN